MAVGFIHDRMGFSRQTFQSTISFVSTFHEVFRWLSLSVATMAARKMPNTRLTRVCCGNRALTSGDCPAPEPGTGRRWLYVWDSPEKAQAFADELQERTRDNAWRVVEVAAPPSEGPMGPVIVQVGRRATGLVFGLHPLSRAMIQSAFPDAKGMANSVSIDFETSQDFLTTHGGIKNLAREVVPTLTGLTLQELEMLGYALIEDDTDRTLVFVRPGDLVQA